MAFVIRKHLLNISKLFILKRFYSSKTCSPLEGVKILDLTRIVAGPYCTMILGDLGAEIIKIEKPNVGDDCRKWGPPFMGSEATYFLSLNRNKKSVCIDLKKKEGKEIMYELVKQCDVLIENYLPGKLDKLHLGYDDLKVIAPHLIYCSITGFGPTGPYKNKGGYDVIAASMGGLLDITGSKDGEPVKCGIPITDITTGLYAHGAILAALLNRKKTNIGEKIDCDLFSSQIASLIYVGTNYLNSGFKPTKWGTAHENIVPYQAFKTKDGYYTIGTGTDEQFINFCQLIDRCDLGKSTIYKTNDLRVKNRQSLLKIIEFIMKEKSNKEWADIFKTAKFPCGPVNNIEETFNDPQLEHINLIQTIEHSSIGPIKLIGPSVKYRNSDNCIRSAPPTLGQHTNEILQEFLHYDEEKLKNLRQKRIIQ